MTKPFCWYQNFVHKGLSAPAPGLFTCGKTLKMCIKSEFKRFVWNLQQMVKVIMAFCWHQKFVPNGVFCPCAGYKIIKNVYKIRFREIILKLATYGQREKAFVVKIFVPNGLSAPPWGYIYMWKKQKKSLNWQQMGSDKELLLTSKFCPPRGCLSLP